MKEIKMSCTTCPSGCTLLVTAQGDTVETVTGNRCPKGVLFAKQELVMPMRMFTSTVRCEDGLLPVRSTTAIPLAKMSAAMDCVRACVVHHGVHRGDVIVPDFVGDGADLIACRNME